MKIAFTGAQGTGKTTLLNNIKQWDLFAGTEFVTNFTRRVSGGEHLNFSGNDVMQLRILYSHVDLLKDAGDFVCDRSLVDAAVYTEYFYQKGLVGKDTLNVSRKLLREYADKYDILFYLKPEFEIEKTDIRSDDKQYQADIAVLFEKILTSATFSHVRVVHLTGSVEERLCQIKEALNG